MTYQYINGLLKDYSAADLDKYEVIKKELRNVITRGKYQERPVQAYLNELEYRCYFCNLEDVTVPLESANEDTVTTTAQTPKEGSIGEFLKDKADNIRKNAEENGRLLPFGNKPKSNNQDVEESNCYQSEEEKVAMAATSQYDETKDAIF